MQEKYSPADVERSAQEHWNKIDAYKVVEHARDAQGREKKKFYACSMLPTPPANYTWAMCVTTPSMM
jgi:leucyl-tRNA synthetase